MFNRVSAQPVPCVSQPNIVVWRHEPKRNLSTSLTPEHLCSPLSVFCTARCLLPCHSTFFFFFFTCLQRSSHGGTAACWRRASTSHRLCTRPASCPLPTLRKTSTAPSRPPRRSWLRSKRNVAFTLPLATTIFGEHRSGALVEGVMTCCWLLFLVTLLVVEAFGECPADQCTGGGRKMRCCC